MPNCLGKYWITGFYCLAVFLTLTCICILKRVLIFYLPYFWLDFIDVFILFCWFTCYYFRVPVHAYGKGTHTGMPDPLLRGIPTVSLLNKLKFDREYISTILTRYRIQHNYSWPVWYSKWVVCVFFFFPFHLCILKFHETL